MLSSVNIALSGLDAAEKRLQVSANNVANQLSTKSRVDGVEVDQPYAPEQVDQVSLGDTGGVTTKTKTVNPATVTVPNSNNPGATIQLPNVDQAQELVNQNIAAYDFKANLKTIRVADNMNKDLLNIVA